MRPDPYAAHDPQLTRRFAGMMQLFTAGALLFIALLDPRSTEGFVTAVLIVVATGTGIALVRGWAVGYDALLAMTYFNLAGLVAVSVLAGAQSDRIEEAYLGVLLAAAALHPPRRVVPVFAVIVGAVLVGKLDGGVSSPEILDMALHLTIWLFIAAVSTLTLRDLRAQRLMAQQDGETAQQEALSDALTQLGNRRRLLLDLDAAIAGGEPTAVAVFDLDGFKAYNDTFGHPAGDALLRRLGEQLAAAVGDRGRAYRMGGDEFCVLAPLATDPAGTVIEEALSGLFEHGEGFTVGASCGEIRIPDEAHSTAEALRLADHRMYARKSASRASAARQSTDVLLRVLAERAPALGEHMEGVAALCEQVAERLGVPPEERPALLHAATLHDVGKAAIPDTILNKPGPLDADEWEFMRRHTIIGERILAAAPALARSAAIVRSCHERFDGGGYPDGLAGEDILLAARIVGACDAYDAMVSDRPYRPAMVSDAALAEVRRCAGTQFDPRVVDALCQVVAAQRAASSYAA